MNGDGWKLGEREGGRRDEGGRGWSSSQLMRAKESGSIRVYESRSRKQPSLAGLDSVEKQILKLKEEDDGGRSGGRRGKSK